MMFLPSVRQCSGSLGFIEMSQSSILGNLLSSIFGRNASQPVLRAGNILRALNLEYPAISLPEPSIHWCQTLHLHQLANLPTNALYGPVQEDKAEAYRFLSKTVSIEMQPIRSFDMRGLHGLNHENEALLAHDSWEAMAQSEQCRHVRIISMNDFNRTLAVAIGKNQNIDLLSTAWEASKVYWADTQNSAELIAALVYARRREVPVNLPVHLYRIRTHQAAIRELKKHYHSLVVPVAAWSDPVFMDYLTTYRIPYVHLPICLGRQSAQTILLPRNNINSNTFGAALQQAGARDIADFLLKAT